MSRVKIELGFSEFNPKVKEKLIKHRTTRERRQKRKKVKIARRKKR